MLNSMGAPIDRTNTKRSWVALGVRDMAQVMSHSHGDTNLIAQ